VPDDRFAMAKEASAARYLRLLVVVHWGRLFAAGGDTSYGWKGGAPGSSGARSTCHTFGMYHRPMARSITVPVRGRRTQAERRAATRTALLDASIECLVEEGYANTTTRRIAERAGVTPGALQHHFASKAELLSEALRHVTKRFVKEILDYEPPDAPSIQAHREQILDRMWEVHKGPFFQAWMELAVAARTDAELRATLAELQHGAGDLNALAAHRLYPEMADQPGFAQVIETAQAATRGLALLAFVDEAEANAAWPAVRAHIIELSAEFIANAEASP
jgi:AcrR family transcriptional regulator